MPIELGVWKINDGLHRVSPSHVDEESRLEDLIEQDPTVIDPDILIVGRQVNTGYGKRIDLLGVNAEGELIVIELKRDRTPRDVVAQTLDYASWVRELSYEAITEVFSEYMNSKGMESPDLRFEEAFSDRFGVNPPETLNESHRLIIVASELDPSTERIITYLSQEYGVPINALFFQHFRDGDNEYLTRTWLSDPREVEIAANRSGAKRKEPWNQRDFYVSLGDGTHRSWQDCVRYGFISGGQGRWYSKTLDMLFPGARVFVCIPGTGYVGVGTVEGTSQPVRDVRVDVDGREVPLLEMPLKATSMSEHSDDPDLSEYVVTLDWIKTLPSEKAIWEKGMFANQNTACRLRNKFTLDRLTQLFGLDQD